MDFPIRIYTQGVPPMPDIMAVLACLSQCLDPTTLRQLGRVIEAMLSISGRVTMKGLSRWSGQGGSYRTIQRLFTTSVNWLQLNWLLIRHHLLDSDDVVLMSGDHVVVTKSGKTTYGLDRFFSSLYGKAVPGLCFLSLSLLSVKRRSSYPVVTEQVDKPLEAPGQAPPKKKSGGSRGRPKGSKNRNRREVELSPSLCFIQEHIKRLLAQIGDAFKVVYFIFDGELGHNDALQMVRQVGLHLISKLRYNSALYLPYDGPYSGRGPRRKYGAKLDYQNIPSKYLKSTSIDKEIVTRIYQMSLWHKKFADLLNIVVIVKMNLKTKKTAHVVLFSSDVSLGYEQVIDYYRLRFQLEFNFRDAKQYWGLEDFMSVKERPVYNSANLAMFMVNLSQALIRPMRDQWPAFSVNDLKAWFRGRKYVVETLKLLPEPPDSIFIDQVVAQMAELGRINHAVNPS
jgi:putative transposase